MLLALLATLTCGQLLEPASPDGPIYSSPSRMNRLAFFEAFPSSGAGTTTACSTTAPTGAKGEVLSNTRSGPATCSPLGTATTGITDASLVVLSANQPRIERDDDGYLGFRSERGSTNVLLRFIATDNAAWSNVGTPTLTSSQVSPFSGTYATSAVQFDDNDAAAFEGRSQSVTVTAGQPYTMHCYVKAGTATSARLLLDGTAATITGLATSSWNIVQVTDASASGASISAQVMVGDATSVTGTVTFGGCQVELGSYRSSIIPTEGVAVVRGADSGLTVDLGPFAPAANQFGVSAYVSRLWLSTSTVGLYPTVYSASPASLTSNSGSGTWFYSPASSGGAWNCLSGNDASTFSTMTTGSALGSATNMIRCETRSGFTPVGSWGTNSPTALGSVIGGVYGPARYLTIGALASGVPLAGTQVEGIISRFKLDADPTRTAPSPVAWIGDSISSDFPALGNTPTRILSTNTARTVANVATPGYTAAQCLTEWTNKVKGKGYRVLVLLCGVNSINTGVSAAATYATLSTIITEAQADGLSVVVLGLTPWANAATWSAPEQVATDDLNALLAATPGITYVSTASLGTGSPLALTVGNDSGDGIHLSLVGRAALAALAQGAL